MLGIVLGLASSVAWGVSDFLGGLQSRRISALSVLLVSQPVGLVLALAVALIVGGSSLSGRDALLGLLAGAIVVLALGAFYRSMALGSVSVAATIGALGVIVPVAAGLLRGEEPEAIQVAGAVAAIVGVSARGARVRSRMAGRRPGLDRPRCAGGARHRGLLLAPRPERRPRTGLDDRRRPGGRSGGASRSPPRGFAPRWRFPATWFRR